MEQEEHIERLEENIKEQRKKEQSSIIVTSGMINELLYRNDADIEFERNEIKRFSEHIEKLDECIKNLLNDRAGLLEALEKAKQGGI